MRRQLFKEDGGIGFIKKDPIVEEAKPEVAYLGGCIGLSCDSESVNYLLYM